MMDEKWNPWKMTTIGISLRARSTFDLSRGPSRLRGMAQGRSTESKDRARGPR